VGVASDSKVLVQAPSGEWGEVEGASEEDDARRLSRERGDIAVYWQIHTVVDLIWIRAFRQGEPVRELLYTSDEGWHCKGAKLPFENDARLAWFLARRGLSASPQGYDVLAAFLGRGGPPPEDDIVDADATQRVYVTGEIAEELRALNRAHGWSAGQVIAAAWEATKRALHELPSDLEEALPVPPPRDAGPICGGPAREIAELAAKSGREKVQAHLALDRAVLAEIRGLAHHLDRPISWVVVEAYRRARPLIAALPR
jgi:hypothetical protein